MRTSCGCWRITHNHWAPAATISKSANWATQSPPASSSRRTWDASGTRRARYRRSDLATNIRRLRNHGSLKRSFHSIGYNSRLDDIHAAVLRIKLRELDKWNDQRRALAKLYDEGLKGTSLKLPTALPDTGISTISMSWKTPHRDALQQYLQERGITALTHYPIAIHQQEGYPWGHSARISGSLKHSERSAAQVLSLPMYPELTVEEAQATIDAIRPGTSPEVIAQPSTQGSMHGPRVIAGETQFPAMPLYEPHRRGPIMTPSRKYTVVVAGCGKRGMHHADAFVKKWAIRAGRALRHRS